MDIKWSYYFIAIIYILVIVLRIINHIKTTQFKKEHAELIEVLSIKKDFFTTVSFCCIGAAVFINGAALWGGKTINVPSLIVTLLVCGFTCINSISPVFLSQEERIMFLLGYSVQPEEIEKYEIKHKKKRTIYTITFTKEIDSYNYIKFVALGKNRKKLQVMIEQMKVS